jgi:enamine deaminase RidA (YjgF/YER057c/UK114 family)
MTASGTLVVLAGQIGWDPLTRELVGSDFVSQASQAFRNIDTLLKTAGADSSALVRMTWYITDRAAYLDSLKAIGAAWREVFGRHYPAMSVVVVSALIEPGALVEIEATAVIAGD